MITKNKHGRINECLGWNPKLWCQLVATIKLKRKTKKNNQSNENTKIYVVLEELIIRDRTLVEPKGEQTLVKHKEKLKILISHPRNLILAFPNVSKYWNPKIWSDRLKMHQFLVRLSNRLKPCPDKKKNKQTKSSVGKPWRQDMSVRMKVTQIQGTLKYRIYEVKIM